MDGIDIRSNFATTEGKRDYTKMDEIEPSPLKIQSLRHSSSEAEYPETFATASILGTDADAITGKDQFSAKSSSVNLPDMFCSIMSVEPLVNVHYEKIKPEADAWAAM